MNAFKIFPFQKNKYFYGKLLTVRDFELEQKYMDEKRYIINKVMFGGGIAAGLRVSNVDEQTIVVEPGFAIDNLGREIVVAENITQKLSFIKGYENNGSKSFYLCLDYNEYGKERVSSVVGTSNETGETKEYNRIQEGYELIIRKSEEVDSLYTYRKTTGIYKNYIIFENEDVSIEQYYPSIVEQGETFESILQIHKKRIEADIELNYRFSTEDLKADFEEVAFKSEDKNQVDYEMKFLLEPRDAAREIGSIIIDKKDFSLIVDQEEKRLENNIIIEVKITTGSKKIKLLEEFNETSLEERFKIDAFDSIYLAKIEIIPIDSSYIIDKITPVPFNQYINNNNQLKNISLIKDENTSFNIKAEVETELVDSDSATNVELKYDYKLNKFKFKFKLPKPQKTIQNITTGIVEINVDETSFLGRTYISDEIDHELGAGPVNITAGIEEESEIGFGLKGKTYYGDAGVFYKSEYEAKENIYTIGIVSDPDFGTFRIGLRVKSSDRERKIKVRWWAYKAQSKR